MKDLLLCISIIFNTLLEMQDIWREYVHLFSFALVSSQPRFSPCSSFWPADENYQKWQITLKLLQLDRHSRESMLNFLFETIEIRCGRPQQRRSLELFRFSPFFQHARRTRIIYVYIDYVYDPWMVGSIAYDYPNVEEIHIINEAPLERRDRDDLMFFVRQMCTNGKKVSFTPAWRQRQSLQRSDAIVSMNRTMLLLPNIPSLSPAITPLNITQIHENPHT